MEEFLSRTKLLIGENAVAKLNKSKVILFGVGGVGGSVLEGLVRGGIGRIDIVDFDCIQSSNLNRQIISTVDCIGESKVGAAKKRALLINPQVTVNAFNSKITPDNVGEFNLHEYDYVVDAIDMVSSKLALVEKCSELAVPIISSMGTGNKLDATMFEVSDIYKTSVCPLARVIRRELKKRGIKRLKVVYSKEEPSLAHIASDERVVGSISFVPPVAGYIIAGEVIKDLVKETNEEN